MRSASPLPRLAAVGAALLLTVGSVLAGPAATADVDDFEFESLHVDYSLSRDADGTSRLHVVETFVALFPDEDQNRGIVRDIPTRERITGFGLLDRHVEVVGVTDGDGRAVPFERSAWTDDDDTRFVSLALGTDAYVHGRTTYVIEWTARDVILPVTDPSPADEFTWDVNGTGWGQPFGAVTAEVHLGDGLEAALTGDTACYDGYAGETGACALERTGDGFVMDAGPLAGGENATIAIGFESGTFASPTPIERSWPFTVLPWVLLGVLAAATVLIVAFRTVLWRHAPGRGIIVPEYEGPDELGVMSAAALLHRPATALPAQLVRLATEGVARLVEDPDASAARRYRLELLDVAAASGRDAVAVRKLFGKDARDGATLVLDRTDRKLGDRVASLTSQMTGEVASRGYAAQGPKSPLRRLIFWPGLAVVAGSIGLAVFAASRGAVTPLLVVQILAGILGGLVVMGFSGKPVRRTPKGTEAYERLLGLRDYLTLAEADRLRVLQSPEGAVRERIDPGDPAAVVRLYERLLPWAIVWGVEKDWADVLAARYDETTPPSSGLAIDASLSAIPTLGKSFASSSFATTSTSTSSGSGGGSFSGASSGGGFSGGGGGGGGGGGR